jgi:5-methylcytosine-specific restriction endonuclease McrA
VSRKVVEKPKPLIVKQPFLGRRPFSVAKKPNLRKSLNENEKILILSNQNMRCNMCQDRLLIHPFTKRKLFDFDHIIPRSKNGSTEVKNMQALCKNCHAVKTAWDLS